MPIRVALRADASLAMGTGHVKRSLALAAALQALGAQVRLVHRDLGLPAAGMAAAAGVEPVTLPPPDPGFEPPTRPTHAAWARVGWEQDARETAQALADWDPDWVVLDHYAFDGRWQAAVRGVLGARMAAIDDLGDRPLDTDLLVDHNWAADHRAKHRVSRVGRLLGGPRYALLDATYRSAPRHAWRERVASIGIFLGGTDPWNASPRVLAACREHAGFAGPVEIATTSANPHLAALHAACERHAPATVLCDAPGLHAFYARHDLHVGAGGGAALERCCIGVPAVALTLADNHRIANDGLASLGVVRLAPGDDPRAWGRAVRELIDDAQARQEMAQRARLLVDGVGPRRVALALASDTLALRPAIAGDALPALQWRNHPDTYRHFRRPVPVDRAAHLAWWDAALRDPKRQLTIAHVGADDVGVFRLDVVDDAAEISLYVDPALTGLGLGGAMLRACQRRVAQGDAPVRRLVADVLQDNDASRRAFVAAGFRVDATGRYRWEP